MTAPVYVGYVPNCHYVQVIPHADAKHPGIVVLPVHEELEVSRIVASEMGAMPKALIGFYAAPGSRARAERDLRRLLQEAFV